MHIQVQQICWSNTKYLELVPMLSLLSNSNLLQAISGHRWPNSGQKFNALSRKSSICTKKYWLHTRKKAVEHRTPNNCPGKIFFWQSHRHNILFCGINASNFRKSFPSSGWKGGHILYCIWHSYCYNTALLENQSCIHTTTSMLCILIRNF